MTSMTYYYRYGPIPCMRIRPGGEIPVPPSSVRLDFILYSHRTHRIEKFIIRTGSTHHRRSPT